MDNSKFTRFSYHNYLETPIIYHPELSSRAFDKNSNGYIIKVRNIVWT